MFLYIRSIAKNEDIAQEITQETFVKALKSIDSFDGSKDIRAWLFTIAKNTYFTYCKRQKIYVDREIDDTMVSQNNSVVASLINEENAFSIHCFLHSMNEPYKEVFTLRVFGELSYK